MQHLSGADPGVDLRGVAHHGHGAVAHRIRVLAQEDLAVVDHDDLLDEVRDLVDQVRREDDGARVLGVVLDQAVVEDLPGDGVEAEVGLVEERDLGARGESDDHPDRGELTAGELLDGLLHRQLELGDELVGEGLIPVREEQARGLERVLGVGVVRVLLALADEADPAEHVRVLVRVLTEHLHGAGRLEVLSGEDRHECRLPRTVAAEEAVDRASLDGERHVVERSLLLVALAEVVHLDDGGHAEVFPSASVVSAARCRSRAARSSAPSPRVRASARSGSM